MYARNNPTSYVDPDGSDARVTVDPARRHVTVATTVHLYGATAKQVTALGNVARLAEAFWRNPTVATQATVKAALAAGRPIPNAGLTARVNGQTWTLKFEISYTVYRGTAPFKRSTASDKTYDIDANRAKAEGVQPGDVLLNHEPNLPTTRTASVAGGHLPTLSSRSRRGVDQVNMLGDIVGPYADALEQEELARRAVHETGHAIGFDERYNPDMPMAGSYAGFDYDVMGRDHREYVLDPTHVSEYLTFAAGLVTPAAPGATPPTKTFLVSGHFDDTKGGKLHPSDQNYPAAQATARAAATARALSNTQWWESLKANPRNNAHDLVPRVPINDVTPPARRSP